MTTETEPSKPPISEEQKYHSPNKYRNKRYMQLLSIPFCVALVANLMSASPADAQWGQLPAGEYYTRGDYVHYSGGDASGHGWWEKESGPATLANVVSSYKIKRSGVFGLIHGKMLQIGKSYL